MKITSFFTALALSVTAFVANAGEKIVIKGSDTLGAKMVPQLAEAYKAAGNDVDFEIAAEGSSVAFTSLLSGTAVIGMSSRDVKDQEKNEFVAAGKELKEHVAGADMIAVVVNKGSSVRELTKDQIEGIFTGDITNWNQVGGSDSPISVYTRNTSSGTYKSFQKLAMNKRDYGVDTQKLAGNEQIAQEVAKNVSGIGYVGLAYAKNEGIKSVKVDGVPAKPRKVDEYPIARKLFYYTIGDPAGEAGKFLTWATTSEEAAKIVASVGFISNEAK